MTEPLRPRLRNSLLYIKYLETVLNEELVSEYHTQVGFVVKYWLSEDNQSIIKKAIALERIQLIKAEAEARAIGFL